MFRFAKKRIKLQSRQHHALIIAKSMVLILHESVPLPSESGGNGNGGSVVSHYNIYTRPWGWPRGEGERGGQKAGTRGAINAATSVSPAMSAKVSHTKRSIISTIAPITSHTFLVLFVMTLTGFAIV